MSAELRGALREVPYLPAAKIREIKKLLSLINAEREKLRSARSGGRPTKLRTAIEATQSLTTCLELAVTIATACFYARINKKASRYERIMGTDTRHGIQLLCEWLRIDPNEAVHLLDLARQARILESLRSPGKASAKEDLPATMKPGKGVYKNLRPFLFICAAELAKREAVFRAPSPKPEIHQNRRAGDSDPPSAYLPRSQAERAAQVVHRTPWRVNEFVLSMANRILPYDFTRAASDAKKASAARKAARRDHVCIAHVCSASCGPYKRGPRKGEFRHVYTRGECVKLLVQRGRREGKSYIRHADADVDLEEAQDFAKKKRGECRQLEADFKVLEVANTRAGEFYIPVYFDFRGRLYQDATLQYTSGSDLARGLLEFARGKRLSGLRKERGEASVGYAIQGLKMHIANCYGHGQNRGTDAARVAWVEENRSDIEASVDAPFTHKFWEAAEDKWRFLAAAHAWLAAENNDAELHVPVALDATNSGLQHCCLLLRDEQLAPLVNLGTVRDACDAEGNFIPRDIYQHLADTLAEKGIHVGRDEIKGTVSAALDDEDNPRKQAKGVVVPMIYGSKKARKKDRDAIWGQLRDVEALLDWFKDAAAAAPRGLGWDTPSGFRVEQHSRVLHGVHWVDARLSDGPFRINNQVPTDELDTKKQKKSLAANFVHSMDAALLARVVDTCASVGVVDWACAHDSFGVPAWQWPHMRTMASLGLYELHVKNVLWAAWAAWGKVVPVLEPPPGRGLDLSPTRYPGIAAGNPYTFT